MRKHDLDRRNIFQITLTMIIFVSLCSCASNDSDDSDSDDSVDDTGSVDDTDDESPLPGTSGWATINLSSYTQLYRFVQTKIDQTPVFDLEFVTRVTAPFGDVFNFCVFDWGYIAIWRYDGEFTLNTIFDDNSTEDGIDPFSLAYFGPNISDYLLLVRITPDSGEEKYNQYFDTDPGIDPVGLYSGFRGGAYPYDQTTIYAYDGETTTPLATIPEGQIVKAQAWGEDGALIIADSETIWTWDSAQGWTDFVHGAIDSALTDPEGDVLLSRYLGYIDERHQWTHYNVQNGSLVPYDKFDASVCSSDSIALMQGSDKAFWCSIKPDSLICDETDGTESFLVTDIDGNIECRGTALHHGSTESLLQTQW